MTYGAIRDNKLNNKLFTVLLNNYNLLHQQKIYVINTETGKMDSLNTTNQGVHQDGETDILIRLLQPLFLKQEEIYQELPQHNIPWNFFTLQDAIEFAVFATKATIDTISSKREQKQQEGLQMYQ